MLLILRMTGVLVSIAFTNIIPYVDTLLKNALFFKRKLGIRGGFSHPVCQKQGVGLVLKLIQKVTNTFLNIIL